MVRSRRSRGPSGVAKRRRGSAMMIRIAGRCIGSQVGGLSLRGGRAARRPSGAQSPTPQRMRSHRIAMDGAGHHRVDDLVLRARGFFGGRGGNGCQLAIVRTHSRAFSDNQREEQPRRSQVRATRGRTPESS